MKPTQRAPCPIAALLGLFVLSAAVSAVEPTPEQTEFFEKRIRPVLAEHCYTCHSAQAEKVKGGLRLDTPAALANGGDSGPCVVPGAPERSLLIKAVRYQDKDLRMPPKGPPLSAEQVADLEAWVKMGAPDPRTGGNTGPNLRDPAEARARHWAFQAVVKPALPAVKRKAAVLSPVDAFVLAKLEAKGLKPAARAEPRALIRRLSYDLLGLPPAPEQVEAFVADSSPAAWARLVDALLASPHFGERWGRYWLDVARYADTKGYLAGGEERRYPFSHTYRDYVIRAFNEDKPYDRFLTEQLAADLLPAGEDRAGLAALGFLTLGRRFLNNQHDIIDDRLDVVFRGTQGLTVTCARCHDHKFDPVSMADYYGLHGVFASSEEPAEKPLLGELRQTPEYADYLKQIARIGEEIEEFKEKETAKFIGELRGQASDYLLGARDAAALKEPGNFDTWAGERKLNPVILRRWMAALETRRQKPDPVFGLWFVLAALPEAEFAARAKPLLDQAGAATPPVNPLVAHALASAKPDSLAKAAEAYAQLFRETATAWSAAVEAAAKEKRPAPAALIEPDREALRQALEGENAPLNLPKDVARQILARRLGEGSAPLHNKIEALNWTHAGAPLRAMALVDAAHPHNSKVLLRGNPGMPGPEAPRQFLAVLAGPERRPFTQGSGRLELARAIASPGNPLTARVYVNRVWLHLFGEGLVSTPGDFGVRTEPPVQRELLDYLAASLIESGWSTKQLLRLVLRSATYQQSCEVRPRNEAEDPENRCLHHQNRRRLDFEAMRDTLLAVSGRLDAALGGLPVELTQAPFPTRRAVYGFIERQNLPGLFRTFDFANPDVSSARRFQTTVPQQALFLMNSPFVVEQARALARRPEVQRAPTEAERIQALNRLAFQRPAKSDEVALAKRFLASHAQPPASPEAKPSDALTPWEEYAQVLLISNEAMLTD